jgi:hypothetical protein
MSDLPKPRELMSDIPKQLTLEPHRLLQLTGSFAQRFDVRQVHLPVPQEFLDLFGLVDELAQRADLVDETAFHFGDDRRERFDLWNSVHGPVLLRSQICIARLRLSTTA